MSSRDWCVQMWLWLWVRLVLPLWSADRALLVQLAFRIHRPSVGCCMVDSTIADQRSHAFD